jgi:xanthine dehydrogenase small subunit
MPLRFVLNDQAVEVADLPPTTTLLDWLRATGRTGTKEGCAEGDCGACTVAVLDPNAAEGPAWRAVCSCILLLPQIADHQIVTVEGLAAKGGLHPAQTALIDQSGSQCGYCTPGFVMSLFEAAHRTDLDTTWKKDDQLCGNLCRCTGYRPIRDALDDVAGTCPNDGFRDALAEPAQPGPVDFVHDEQRFVRPTDWDTLWDALDDDQARIISGATDLGLDVTQRGASWGLLVDVGALPEMRDMTEHVDGWTLGAGTRLSDLETWSQDRLPILARMLRYFASRQIKNRATLGGNLCNASPIGDLPPVLLALDAVAILRSRSGERRVPMASFFVSYRKTALNAGEVLVAVELPRHPSGVRMAAYKVSKRKELDISAVSAAFVVGVDKAGIARHVRIAFGGMAATPARAYAAEEALRGRVWCADAVEHACSALSHDFQPIDDHRASAWYRATVAANLLRGFVMETEDEPIAGSPTRATGTVLSGGAIRSDDGPFSGPDGALKGPGPSRGGSGPSRGKTA